MSIGRWSFRAEGNCERFWAWGQFAPFFLSVNEGRGPINFAIGDIDGRFFLYVFWFGRSRLLFPRRKS